MSDRQDLREKSRATATCVEQKDEFTLWVADQLRHAVKRGQRHNDEMTAELGLCASNESIVLTTPKMHTYSNTICGP